MDRIASLKHELCEQHPILHKTGCISLSCDPSEILRQNKYQKVLVLMVSVQGAGKTTFCSKYFSSDCSIVNPDQILAEYLKSHPNLNVPYSKINERVHEILMQQIKDGLNSGLTVLDAACIDFAFRMHILETLDGMYDKAIIIALNRNKGTIKRQILGQISERIRPDLWEDVNKDFENMKFQLEHHIFEMGVNELYVV